MTEIELVIFSLEIFCIRLRNKYSLKEIKDFRMEVFSLARYSENLEQFKFKLKSFDCSKIVKLYLRYINLMDKYYDYINGKNVYLNFQKDV